MLIKTGLANILALTFAGLHYRLAFLSLAPIFSQRHRLASLRLLDRHSWRQLIALGTILCSVTHGAQFLSLVYLPAVMAMPVLGFTRIVFGLADLLRASGHWLEALPTLLLKSSLIILWLAIVNTAATFTFWTHTLCTLSTMESSPINNTMAVQIPLLVVLFLGESLLGRGWLGLAVVIIGVLIVQTGRVQQPDLALEK